MVSLGKLSPADTENRRPTTVTASSLTRSVYLHGVGCIGRRKNAVECSVRAGADHPEHLPPPRGGGT